MRCICVDKIGDFKFTSAPVPDIGPKDVRVRVEVAGLCRTDLKLIRVGHRDLVLPRVPGEEVVGIVEAVGCEVRGLALGSRVYLYPGVWCGTCAACRASAENLCRDMRIMGFHRDGGMAEYVSVPAQSVLPVPSGLPAEAAVFAEPLSCCLNALELGGIRAGANVAIWGAGPAGTLLNRAARALGGVAINVEPDERRCSLIGGIAEPPSAPVDLAIVAVGNRQAYEEALLALAPRGRLVLFSGLAPAETRLAIDVNRMHYLEQSVVGAYGCCLRHGERALELLSSGDVAVTDLVSHDLSLSELDVALELVASRAGMKILLRP